MIDTSRIILYVLEHIELVNIRCYFLFSVAIDATNSKMDAANSLFDAANSLFDAKMEATNSLFDAVEFFNSLQIFCQCLSIIKNHKNQWITYISQYKTITYISLQNKQYRQNQTYCWANSGCGGMRSLRGQYLHTKQTIQIHFMHIKPSHKLNIYVHKYTT